VLESHGIKYSGWVCEISSQGLRAGTAVFLRKPETLKKSGVILGWHPPLPRMRMMGVFSQDNEEKDSW